MPIRVLLADDQPLVRVSLDMMITDAPDLEAAGEAATGAEAVRKTAELRPDVVLMDIRMPDLDGIEATRQIMAAPEPPHVIVLTTFEDDDLILGALQAGASGFLVKSMPLEDILAAIRVTAANDALIAPAATRRLVAEAAARPTSPPTLDRQPGPNPRTGARLEQLTERETELLTLIGLGRSNTEIAAELFISMATVKTYVSRLLTKLDARDRVHLVITAYAAGLVNS
jgi:DNA-binding NarL/FixJ family response regulator